MEALTYFTPMRFIRTDLDELGLPPPEKFKDFLLTLLR